MSGFVDYLRFALGWWSVPSIPDALPPINIEVTSYYQGEKTRGSYQGDVIQSSYQGEAVTHGVR